MVMDRLHPEILQPIFENLDSVELVRAKRVSKRWFDLIDGTKSLWTKLVLADHNESDSLTILELFDRKSGSWLKQVSLRIHHSPKASLESFRETLLKSTNTIQYLQLFVDGAELLKYFSQLSWKLPNLIDCIIGPHPLASTCMTSVCLNHKSVQSSSSGLRTLWIPFLNPILDYQLYRIDSISSLHVEEALSFQQWRRVLEKPAQTLRDLKLSFQDEVGDDFDDEEEEEEEEESDDDENEETHARETAQPAAQLSDLEFPNLKVLWIGRQGQPEHFPNWMRIPPPCTLILQESLQQGLPSVSSLVIPFPRQSRWLEDRCPVLAELRIEEDGREDIYHHAASIDEFISMLRKRSRNVEAGKEIDGVRMIPIKRLLISFSLFSKVQIGEMKKSVEKIVHLGTADRKIKVEI